MITNISFKHANQFLSEQVVLLRSAGNPQLAFAASWRGRTMSCPIVDPISEEYLRHRGVFVQ